MTLLIDSGSFTDRIDGTGILPTEAARDLGVTGLAARASGLDEDLRRDHPHDAYDALRFEVPVEEGGDVRARLMVRAREVEQSLAILAPGPGRAARLSPADGASGRAAGLLRRPGLGRGVARPLPALGGDRRLRGRSTRVKVTDPSFRNWPGLAHAVPGNIIPDFPVINKSFNLSYSGNDR